jgi:putative membrane protein
VSRNLKKIKNYLFEKSLSVIILVIINNKNMEKIFWYLVGGVLSIYLATLFVSGVALEIIPGQNYFFGIEFTKQWQLLLIVGGVLGFINIFIKPIISAFSLPFKILTLGFFPLILNMLIIWFLDIIFLEFIVIGLTPLFFTAIITSIINFLLDLKK